MGPGGAGGPEGPKGPTGRHFRGPKGAHGAPFFQKVQFSVGGSFFEPTHRNGLGAPWAPWGPRAPRAPRMIILIILALSEACQEVIEGVSVAKSRVAEWLGHHEQTKVQLGETTVKNTHKGHG